ncbi:MAG: patatin-like phospholipase family protein [Candidatus Gracilibacteria bacterium]|nr:patatin-like phospholipase family protein [Candidatus Gracilibacteria bacterium]
MKKDKSFGIAFGGGAARGLAHIGVLRYLEENSLKAKDVSGTSIGAIIASLYAFGKTSQEMRDICASINYLKLIDFDLKKGLIAGNKIKVFLKDIFGSTKIEDLDMPLHIISTNINTGEKKIFDSGSIVDAIRSSISIPGIIMPNKIKHEDLVDGGINNNLPIEVSKQDKVLAISVLRDISRPIETKINFLGFEIKQNIFGLGYQILQKSIDIMMEQNENNSVKSREGIVFLHPIMPGIDYYEFHKYDEIIEIGYKSAMENNLCKKLSD